jgi:ribonucleoside-diphosphate reductase alpha chain
MYSDYYWLNDDSRTFLERGYLDAGETPEKRIRDIAETAEKYLEIKGYAEKFEDYMKKGFFSLSTPIWVNFGKTKGLPISCNGSYISDKMDSILYALAEVGMMTKNGAGTSVYFGDLRPRGAKITAGGESTGPVHFMELFEVISNVTSQGQARRGSCAVYLPIDHSDIKEFLAIRSDGHPIQNLSIGVTITDAWMEDMIGGNEAKRKIWAKVIQKRFESGYPYIFFTDTANKNAPQVYKDKGMKIHASNLCSEICLSSSPDESFVCDLSAMNLLHYDDWKDTDAVETLSYFLDAVMSEYIEKTAPIKFMDRAHNFAKNQRALGLGALGWHSFLQYKNIAFESMDAKFLNNEIFKLLKEKTDKASVEMVAWFGEPELLKGYGRRNVTMMTLMPTTSSSFILGQVSQSVEPLNSNYFVKKLAKGNFTYKNPYLKKVLKKYNKDSAETWESILIKGGSVQHLSFLSDHEKDVFKTFGEISQKEIIVQTAQRQKYIDQSQSINLMIHPQTSVKDVNMLLIDAWKMGVKSLYYQRSTNPSQELSRSILACRSCEG